MTRQFNARFAPVGAGRLVSVTYPGGVSTDYGYDAAGNQTSLSIQSTHPPHARRVIVRNACYDANNTLTQTQYGTSFGLVTSQSQLDPRTGDVTHFSVVRPTKATGCTAATGRHLLTQSSCYDTAGMLSVVATSGTATTSDARPGKTRCGDPDAGDARSDPVREQLQRDGFGRLLGANVTGPQTADLQSHYTYRGDGGLASADSTPYRYAGDSCGALGACPGRDGVLRVGSRTFKYGAGGYMIRRMGRQIVWNADGEATWIQGNHGWSHDVYDASGQLVYSARAPHGPEQHVTKVRGVRLFGDYEAVGRAVHGVTRYLYLDGQLAATEAARGGLSADLQGQTGSVGLTVAHGGRVASYRTYSPYGAVDHETRSSSDPHGYLGGWTDAGTGIVLLGARWYDPTSGQFLSPDPMVGNPAPPGTDTPYSYGDGDPVSNPDPTGLQAGCDDGGGEEDPGGEDPGDDEGGGQDLTTKSASHADCADPGGSTGDEENADNGSSQSAEVSDAEARQQGKGYIYSISCCGPGTDLPNGPTPPPPPPTVVTADPGNDPETAWGAAQRWWGQLSTGQKVAVATVGVAVGVAAVYFLAIPALEAAGVALASGTPAAGSGLAVAGAGAATVLANTPAAEAVEEEVSELAAPAAEAAGNAAETVQGVAQVTLNNLKGRAYENALADMYRQAGFYVEQARGVNRVLTAIGVRYPDLAIYKDGQLLEYIEVKTGNSPYTMVQQLKDIWIERMTGVITNLIRDGDSAPPNSGPAP